MKTRKKNGFWTKENCKIEALKYKTRRDLRFGNRGVYNKLINNKWLNEVCEHMGPVGDLYKRCVYVYKFSDNSVYVGLTYDINIRHNEHIKRGPIYEHINKMKIQPKLIQLTDYIDVNDAKIKEEEYVNEYKKSGWNVLNKVKTGSVGSVLIWVKEKCQKESLKYNTKFEFQMGSSGAYNSSLKNKWLDDICDHMIKKKEMWISKKKCQKESLKYKTKIDFRKKSSGAYSSSLKNKWLNDICDHMESNWKRNFWNYNECKKESLKYSSRNEFSNTSRKNGWLNEFFPKN